MGLELLHCHCSTAAHFSMSDDEYERLIRESAESSVLFKERFPEEVETQISKEFPFFNKSYIVLRQERLEHILEKHTDIGNNVTESVRQVIKNPSKILLDHKNKDSILAIGRGVENNVNVAIKLSRNDKDNSIITAIRVSDKTIKRIMKKNNIIYDKN